MNFEVISPKNLESYLQQHTALLIDVRSREEYRSGYWAGARNYPYEEAEHWEHMLPKNAVLVFYCSHGGTSMQLARRLGMQGFRTASVIGGYPAMQKQRESY